jgi:hypothetical protein
VVQVALINLTPRSMHTLTPPSMSEPRAGLWNVDACTTLMMRTWRRPCIDRDHVACRERYAPPAARPACRPLTHHPPAAKPACLIIETTKQIANETRARTGPAASGSCETCGFVGGHTRPGIFACKYATSPRCDDDDDDDGEILGRRARVGRGIVACGE